MTVICQGSLVLVTGISGLIGSHVADHLLRAGYRVRGAVRSEQEAQMMHDIYQKRHPKAPESFETIVIADMKVPGAFKGHLAGCDGIAHVASDLSFSPDPNVVITGCVNGIKAILEEAKSTPSVKRFVYTSSSNAATRPLVGEPRHVDSSSWNDDILEEAWAPPPYEINRAYAVYAASKVACERAAWAFMKDQRPGFTFNTVLPNYTSGIVLQPLSIPGAGSTARWVRDVYDHPFEKVFVSKLRDDSPQWQVDVEDIAKLHLATLTFDDVSNERLLGFAHRFNYNSFLQTFRKLAPEREWPADRSGLELPSTVIENKRSIELLRRFGANGWVPFHESVRRSCLDEYGDGFAVFDGSYR
ncbi:NAD(P)-binding protein [Macroventuria anomochaeta]|uniref:NAD(P)-binding protein n=1 Tax=Macroventuria anomochaeta TaxID=301207 RepID=A0ACB6S4M1_9PLEO|nr:NAD(P)-binding protein [Macroventuria anomochaeta]KAF2628313.1 NAD(P)-binding protein [Macroventuria anomochaeta]